MAIRQVTGGVPVYSIEVDVPKPTDSRGKGYGSLVSDLRWKLWQEVQESQLQQMKFEQLTKQAQLDVLEQQQRDISRAIRDANEQKAKIKAGTATAGSAPKALGYTIEEVEEGRSPITGMLTGQKITKTKTKTPTNIVQGAGVDSEKALEQQKAQFEQQRSDLDAYIEELEAQQTQLGTRFQALAGQPVGRDILSRTREAFQTQIGEGGFGISRRPLRQLPRFDEVEAVGRVQDAIAREEQNLLNEAIRRKQSNRIAELNLLSEGEMSGAYLAGLPPVSLTLDEERMVRELARKKFAGKLTAAGAEPTSRAGFLMKPLPPSQSGLLPREETRFPTGRVRDDFGVGGPPPAMSREMETLIDIGSEKLPFTFYPEDVERKAEDESSKSIKETGKPGFFEELQAIRAGQTATERGNKSETPIEQTVRRNLEMEALGAPYDVNYPPTIEDAAAVEIQRRIDDARMARDRGFKTPFQDISGFQQGVMGRPGGMADRRVVNRLLRQSEASGGLSGAPSIEPTPAQPKPSVANAEDLNFIMGPPLPPTADEAPTATTPGPEIVPEEPVDEMRLRTRRRPELPQMDEERGRIPLGNGVMLDPFESVIYGKEGFPLFRTTAEPTTNTSAPYQPQVVTPKEFEKKVKEIKEAGGYEPPQAKLTVPQRREIYAMNTIKRGLELADKPKQFARVSKTDNPSTAAEYVRLVNGVYELNSTRPDRFKASFDEIARVYKNDPKNRELALSYLVAKDAIESNVTKPMA